MKRLAERENYFVFKSSKHMLVNRIEIFDFRKIFEKEKKLEIGFKRAL